MRYIFPHVLDDLKKKMVFVGGPRQVGKTTLAKAVLEKQYPSGRYFNWDLDEDRQDILRKRWSNENDLLVLDELHKYPRWKRWIKGVYDTAAAGHAFLITGSARLDVYRRGGDSLMGRYHYWRLHPFTLDDIPQGIPAGEALGRLMTVGGFPEPFFDADERSARRWRRERFDRVLREDVRDLESVRNIQLLSLMLDSLRNRVGSLIVVSNVASELQISPGTAKSWLDVLERMYLVFAVRPLTRSIPRAVLKPPKIYLFDSGDVIGDDGARFENVVAAALLKRIHFMEDHGGYRCDLRYIRDKEGREVDFAVIREGRIEELIEVKLADEEISKSLRYYTQRLKPRRATQIVAGLKRPYRADGIDVMHPCDYFGDFFANQGTVGRRSP